MRLMIRQKLIMKRTIALASVAIAFSGILFFIFHINGKTMPLQQQPMKA